MKNKNMEEFVVDIYNYLSFLSESILLYIKDEKSETDFIDDISRAHITFHLFNDYIESYIREGNIDFGILDFAMDCQKSFFDFLRFMKLISDWYNLPNK